MKRAHGVGDDGIGRSQQMRNDDVDRPRGPMPRSSERGSAEAQILVAGADARADRADMGDIFATAIDLRWRHLKRSRPYLQPQRAPGQHPVRLCQLDPLQSTGTGRDVGVRHALPDELPAQRGLATRRSLQDGRWSLMEWNLANFVPQPVAGPKIYSQSSHCSPHVLPHEIKLPFIAADCAHITGSVR